MNIQTINNKHYTELDVVMVETKDTTPIFLHKDKTECADVDLIYGSFYHIHFLSNEKPKAGDYIKFYVKPIDKEWVHKLTEQDLIDYPNINNQGKKIEATSDSSLTLNSLQIAINNNSAYEGKKQLGVPQIPQQFIGHFIPEFNKGNVIQKVQIEMVFNGKWEIKFNSNEVIPLIDVLEFTPFHKPDFNHLEPKETLNLAIELKQYIKDKHTQEECIGFIDGFKKAYEIFNK
jgi:hypothetical protein